MPLAGDAYRSDEDPWRDHLGASLIGRECARAIWYGFRWTTLKKFDGRLLRLLNRGHLEEPRLIALLKLIGCKVWQQDDSGRQFRITGHKGHFGGSLDGVALGIPDRPDEPVLLEFKTHGDASYAKLAEAGVISAKWEHFVQMQIYMGKHSLNWALYCAVNKNDDNIHLELVQFDPTQYQRYLDRAAAIVEAKEPPPKINASPGWFKCKFCDHKEVCHSDSLPVATCRSCSYIKLEDAGGWSCTDSVAPGLLSAKDQRRGCSHYVLNEAFKNTI